MRNAREHHAAGGRRPRPGTHRTPVRRASRLLGATAALVLLGTACHADGDASEPLTVAEQRARLAADSAAGDAAALAALPPALGEVLWLEPYLTDRYFAAADSASCVFTDPPGAGGGLGLPAGGERRRLEFPLPDSSTVVIGLRTDASRVGLELVELFHYPHRDFAGRRAFQWEADDDHTVEVRWPPQLGGREERAPVPRGGPVPRALRAIARRALALQCTPEQERPRADTLDGAADADSTTAAAAGAPLDGFADRRGR